MNRLVSFLAVPLVAHAQSAPNGTFFTAPYGPGGTWNLYQAHSAPLTWTQAQARAEGIVDPLGGTGKPGHLVAIGSAVENMFVYQQVEGAFVWIGLTDNERWGGTEAGSDRQGGWRWVTGEPVTFAAWRGSEPNEMKPPGEDGAAMGRVARWSDWPLGFAGQQPLTNPFMIEWETRAAAPVPGARVIGPILPSKWRVDLSSWKGEVTGAGPWTVHSVVGIPSGSIQSVVAHVAAGLPGMKKAYRMPRLNYRFLVGNPPLACGWVDLNDRPLHPVSDSGYGALHVAKLRVEKPGTWSFSIHGDDYFAMRIPGLKWKSATGLGGIDPSDPSTVYFGNDAADGRVIGVIDLPAGEHVIEVVLGNLDYSSAIQLLAAPGEITMEGATDKWRFPGHKAGGDLAWPGIDSKGWTVTRTDRPPGSPALTNLVTGYALAMQDIGKTTEGVAKINFIDSGGAGDIEFPQPVSFPGDTPGGQNEYVIKSSGDLVIPRDGVYHIGFHADDCCAMRIVGQPWKRVIRDSGLSAKLEGDTVHAEFPVEVGTNTQVVGEVELKKGTYPVEVFYTEIDGPSVLSVFAAPAGYAPRLLAKDGAKIEPDIDGLPLVD